MLGIAASRWGLGWLALLRNLLHKVPRCSRHDTIDFVELNQAMQRWPEWIHPGPTTPKLLIRCPVLQQAGNCIFGKEFLWKGKKGHADHALCLQWFLHVLEYFIKVAPHHRAARFLLNMLCSKPWSLCLMLCHALGSAWHISKISACTEAAKVPTFRRDVGGSLMLAWVLRRSSCTPWQNRCSQVGKH